MASVPGLSSYEYEPGPVSAANWQRAVSANILKRASVQELRNHATPAITALYLWDEAPHWTPQQLVDIEARARMLLEIVRYIRAEESYGGRDVQ